MLYLQLKRLYKAHYKQHYWSGSYYQRQYRIGCL